MQNRVKKFLKLHWPKILSIFLFVLLFSAYAHIFARTSSYSPGQTLDPTDCSPGEENCTVDIGGGSSLWATSGSDIYYNDGNVGIGTDTPTSKLDIKLNPTVSYSLSSENVTGLNDATFSGTYTGAGTSFPYRILLQIDSEGTPDTFTYYSDDYTCSYTTHVPITGSPQLLCDGISVTFASTTGHTMSDQWQYIINSDFSSINPVFKISDGTNNYFTVNAVAPDSIFLGTGAGIGAGIYATNSNFLGTNAGSGAYGSYDSNFIGHSAGSGASSSMKSNFLGFEAGLSSSANYSNFMGPEAGYGATGISSSNFFGPAAGKNASQVSSSNFFNGAGSDSSDISASNFFGPQAGYGATGISSSNFFGPAAGMNATGVSGSNFLGDGAGLFTSATNSNFFGYYAGKQATNAYASNFFGYYAGNHATFASYSNFLGAFAGNYATNASNSIFIGQNAGIGDNVNNTTNVNDWSILLGYNTNTGGNKNSILLGGASSATAIANTKANQFMLAPSITEMRLRGIDYSLPSAQGGANTVLTNNGSGGLSWEEVSGGGGGDSSPWLTSGSDIYYNDGNVGIGTDTPTSLLDIKLVTTLSYTQTFNEDDENGDSLDDATYSGTYTGEDIPNRIFVWVDSEDDPDTFGYEDDNGDCPEVNNVSITGLPQLLCDGISITFDSVTGHSIDNGWEYEISNSPASTNPVFNIGAGTDNYFSVNAVVSDSIFLGIDSGIGATNASGSNFLGNSAGIGATNATDSNFLGIGAGQSAINTNDSNFLGGYAGSGATDAYQSNFLGTQAGQNATDANNSNFFGPQAGQNAINAHDSNFFGEGAGGSAWDASYSNFFGQEAGHYADNASNSIFIGQNAGYHDSVNNTTNGLSSILIGSFTNTGNFSNSILLGSGVSGFPISNTKINQFMLAPTVTEMRLRGVDYSLPSAQGGASTILTNNGSGGLTWGTAPASSPITIVNTSNLFSTGLTGIYPTGGSVTTTNSIFLGDGTGYQATNASYSNFFGLQAGKGATNAHDSNFLGVYAGVSATGASNSNFFGFAAGDAATNAEYSNFLGTSAGSAATSASYSNFLGDAAGAAAISASNSNFLGTSAGQGATNASYSNFFGQNAGQFALSASYSNLFGFQTGMGNSIGSNNIIIGTNISLPNATTNALNLGGVLFATGTYAITSGNPSITAVADGKVGIGVVSPTYTLQVGTNTGATGIIARFENINGTCDVNPTFSSVVCSSDMNLKKNIMTLDGREFALQTIPDLNIEKNTLDKILELNAVTYNWNNENNTDSKHIGFIAQEMEQIFPDLVFTDPITKNKSISYTNLIPYTVKAIQEMNLKIEDLSSLDTTSATSLGSLIGNFLSDATNNLSLVFFGEVHTKKLCLDDLCITKVELQQILNNNNATPNTTEVIATPEPESTPEPAPIISETETIPELAPSISEPIIIPATEIAPIIETTPIIPEPIIEESTTTEEPIDSLIN